MSSPDWLICLWYSNRKLLLQGWALLIGCFVYDIIMESTLLQGWSLLIGCFVYDIIIESTLLQGWVLLIGCFVYDITIERILLQGWALLIGCFVYDITIESTLIQGSALLIGWWALCFVYDIITEGYIIIQWEQVTICSSKTIEVRAWDLPNSTLNIHEDLHVCELFSSACIITDRIASHDNSTRSALTPLTTTFKTCTSSPFFIVIFPA